MRRTWGGRESRAQREELIGHVATRPGQLQMDGVPTGGGAWAPTIRWRDGTFYVVVTDALGRGTLLFTAADPAGPWSDGRAGGGRRRHRSRCGVGR